MSGSDEVGGEVVLVPVGAGVLLSGRSDAVATIVGRLTDVGNGVRRRSLAADGATLVSIGTALGMVGASHEYVELTEASRQLLEQHGSIPVGAGSFAGYVRDEGGRFAGNIQWRPASFAPHQALAVQQAATTLALRAAIHEVSEAVERVESKVDDIRKMLKADRVGDVIGTHWVLQPLDQRVRSSGDLSPVDWDTIQHLGTQIEVSLQALRAYLRSHLDTDRVLSLRDRARAAEALAGRDVEEALALLVVAEHNFSSWQILRVNRVTAVDPGHLAVTLDDLQAQVARHRADDQLLVAQFDEVLERILEPSGLEGLSLLQRRRLERNGREAFALANWFADQRTLDPVELDAPALPGLRQSVQHLAGRAGDTLGKVRDRSPALPRLRHTEMRARIEQVTERSGDRTDVELEFTRAMVQLCDRLQAEISYNPTAFRRMVGDYGGAEAARRLLSSSKPQSGLEKLWEHGHLADSVEAHVLLPRFGALFDDKERSRARERLEAHGFDVEAFLAKSRRGASSG